ncbi:MAG: type II secretion system protein [Thermodesulfovibrionales bacterium]
MNKHSIGTMRGGFRNPSIGRTFGAGFTLLEVMISVAIIAGLLVTLIYTLNYHLGIADRQGIITVTTLLAKAKMYEVEQNPTVSKGAFPDPYTEYSYETSVKDSLLFPGMSQISVVVKNGKEDITLSELIRKAQYGTMQIPKQ